MRGLILSILLLLGPVYASDFMPVWQAFQVSVEAESQQSVWVNFNIAADYHVYQNKIKIRTLPTSSVKLGVPLWPEPQEITAPNVGKFRVYEGKVAIRIPVTYVGNGDLDLEIAYQGCKNVELCYPEQTVSDHIDLFHPKEKVRIIETPTASSTFPVVKPQAKADFATLVDSGNSRQIAAWFAQSTWLVIGGFFIVGLLLAFTPCVFPMLPVLIGVIAGNEGGIKRSFFLALSYILGGATLYAGAGIAAASLGYSLSGSLQSAWVSYLVAILFMLFAMSLFGLFELRLPYGLQNRLNSTIGKFRHRSFLSAFIIGGLANLVLSPCVTGPLAGALVYISTTGDKVLGGMALFALGLGSGVPLLLIAVFGKSLLPKTGNWLFIVKQALALLMLLMAVYMLSKVVAPGDVSWLGGLWLFILAWYLIGWLGLERPRRLLMILIAIVIAAGIFYRNHQLQNNDKVALETNKVTKTVKNISALQTALNNARDQGKQVILDYYADWCIACKEMDIKTFANPQVAALLQNYAVIRVDITDNGTASQLLQQRYDIIAPPSLVFINKDGKALDQFKTVGFIDSDKLSHNLQQALQIEK